MLVYLDWTGDDGKLGRLNAGPHVEDHVLMADVGQGSDICQPELDLLIIPGDAAVDDNLSMPPALVDGGLGPSLDHLPKLKLTVFDPEQRCHKFKKLTVLESVGYVWKYETNTLFPKSSFFLIVFVWHLIFSS